VTAPLLGGKKPRSTLRRLLPWVVTVGIFTVIFSQIDRGAFWASLRGADLGALAIAIALFVPIISGSVERWRWMLKDHATLPFRTGVRIFLAATSLNSVMPSKLGDLGKAIFLEREGITDLERASSSVLLEKILDLAGLCCVFLAGYALGTVRDGVTFVVLLFSVTVLVGTSAYLTAHHPRNHMFPMAARLLARWPALHRIVQDSPRFTAELATRPWRLGTIIAVSPALWVLHMIQIFYFFRALNSDVDFLLVMALTPIAILVGLLPLSVAGMGTRDAALVGLFLPWVPASTLVGVGLLLSTRYWIPSALGVFFLPRFLNERAA
jgi:glycosyltransferase 2 family protein